MTQPKKKSDVLIDEINGMLGCPIDSKVLARIEDDAQKIYQSGKTGDARHVQGMIAALKRDLDGAIERFTAALRILGRDPLVLENYATALDNLGVSSLAVAPIEDALSIQPDATTTLYQAAQIYGHTFQHEKLESVIAKLALRGLSDEAEKFMQTIQDREIVLAKHAVLAHEICTRVELVSELLRVNGIMSPNTTEVVFDDDILYEIVIFSDLDGALRAESMICDKIASLPFSPIDNLLRFSCVPYEFNA